MTQRHRVFGSIHSWWCSITELYSLVIWWFTEASHMFRILPQVVWIFFSWLASYEMIFFTQIEALQHYSWNLGSVLEIWWTLKKRIAFCVYFSFISIFSFELTIIHKKSWPWKYTSVVVSFQIWMNQHLMGCIPMSLRFLALTKYFVLLLSVVM